MDKPKVTPRDFFLWAGAMLALYVGVFDYIALVWNYINYALPNPLAYYAPAYNSGIGWEMASLIILTPVFLILMLFIHRGIARDPSRREVWVRRWALFLTLFIAGITIVIDLIWVLYAFLSGSDLTESFLLKALVVLLVAAVGFMHFTADLWGYWDQFPERNRYVMWGVIALVLVTIVGGFFIVGTPMQQRQYRFDDQKVSDLQTIQSQIVSYWQEKQQLPAALADLSDSINGFTVPKDPQTGAAYGYKATAPVTFQLCANFNAPTQAYSQTSRSYPMAPVPAGAAGADLFSDSWAHGAGDVCFTRTIDPSRYPPQNKLGK